MKKNIKVIIIIFICFILSGCYYYDNTGTINEDHSFKAKFYIAIHDLDYDYYDAADQEDVQEFIDNGFSFNVEDFDEGQYSVLEKTFPSINDLCTDDINHIYDFGFFTREDGIEKYLEPMFYCKKEFNKTTYYANFHFKYRVYVNYGENPGWYDPSEEVEEGSNNVDITTVTKLSYSISLGDAEVIDNNATVFLKEDNILFWEINPVGDNYINFSFILTEGPQIDFNDNDLSIQTESAEINDLVTFKVRNPKEVDKIFITDKNGNIISYNIVNEETGEYSFILPDKDVKIKVQYRITNPSTYKSNSIIYFIIILLLITIFYHLYKHKEKET